MEASKRTSKHEKSDRNRSRFFFQEDAFWRGVASAFNVWGNFSPRYHGRDPQQADYEALRGDWEAIGRDMEVVLRRFEQEHAEELGQARSQQRLFDPKGLEQEY